LKFWSASYLNFLKFPLFIKIFQEYNDPCKCIIMLNIFARDNGLTLSADIFTIPDVRVGRRSRRFRALFLGAVACRPQSRFPRRNCVAPRNDRLGKEIPTSACGLLGMTNYNAPLCHSEECLKNATWEYRHSTGRVGMSFTTEIATPRFAWLAMTKDCHSEECVSTTWESRRVTRQWK